MVIVHLFFRFLMQHFRATLKGCDLLEFDSRGSPGDGLNHQLVKTISLRAKGPALHVSDILDPGHGQARSHAEEMALPMSKYPSCVAAHAKLASTIAFHPSTLQSS